MELKNLSFAEHQSCEALVSSILQLPPSIRAERILGVRANHILWVASDIPRSVYLLESGKVEIVQRDRHGRSILLQVVRPGEIFGYLCFCDHRTEPLETEARVTMASVVHRTGYREFNTALKSNSALAERLTEALCARVSGAEQQIRLLGIQSGRHRLATLLHQLAAAKLASLNVSKAPCLLHLTHAEIAALASLTRPHTTVLMTQLRTDGVINYHRGSAIQVNLPALRTLLGD